MDVPQPVVVVAEASRREGLSTRYSVFVGLRALQTAAKEGWSEHISGNGETMYLFHPPLLPVQAMADRFGVTLPPNSCP